MDCLKLTDAYSSNIIDYIIRSLYIISIFFQYWTIFEYWRLGYIWFFIPSLSLVLILHISGFIWYRYNWTHNNLKLNKYVLLFPINAFIVDILNHNNEELMDDSKYNSSKLSNFIKYRQNIWSLCHYQDIGFWNHCGQSIILLVMVFYYEELEGYNIIFSLSICFSFLFESIRAFSWAQYHFWFPNINYYIYLFALLCCIIDVFKLFIFIMVWIDNYWHTYWHWNGLYVMIYFFFILGIPSLLWPFALFVGVFINSNLNETWNEVKTTLCTHCNIGLSLCICCLSPILIIIYLIISIISLILLSFANLTVLIYMLSSDKHYGFTRYISYSNDNQIFWEQFFEFLFEKDKHKNVRKEKIIAINYYLLIELHQITKLIKSGEHSQHSQHSQHSESQHIDEENKNDDDLHDAQNVEMVQVTLNKAESTYEGRDDGDDEKEIMESIQCEESLFKDLNDLFNHLQENENDSFKNVTYSSMRSRMHHKCDRLLVYSRILMIIAFSYLLGTNAWLFWIIRHSISKFMYFHLISFCAYSILNVFLLYYLIKYVIPFFYHSFFILPFCNIKSIQRKLRQYIPFKMENVKNIYMDSFIIKRIFNIIAEKHGDHISSIIITYIRDDYNQNHESHQNYAD